MLWEYIRRANNSRAERPREKKREKASMTGIPGADEFLPLTPVAFEILLSLAREERHGYAIMRDIEGRTEGAVSLHAGTLYRALGRLVDQGLIAELEERPEAGDDERRRYYGITALGRRVAMAESRRVARQVEAAVEMELVAPGRGVREPRRA